MKLDLTVLGRISLLILLGIFPCDEQAQIGAKTITGPDESLFKRISVNDCVAPTDSQFSEVTAAVANFHRSGNRRDEARALILLASLYEQAGGYKQAMPSLQSALPLV